MAQDRTDGALTHQSQATIGGQVSAPSLVGGTAKIINATLDCDVYIVLTGSGTGTYSLDIVDAGGNATNVVTTAEVPATMTQLVQFHLQAGWSIKITLAGGVAITKVTAITS